ncbi:MAG: hypothetical protein HN811_04045, partial [Phycisphaerae bacterium]|nr:hypothetical protein [Phycisphaerae bacterium]
MVTTSRNGRGKKAGLKSKGFQRGTVRGGSKDKQEGTMARKSSSVTETKNKNEALERAISQIDTAFGTGSIMR